VGQKNKKIKIKHWKWQWKCEWLWHAQARSLLVWHWKHGYCGYKIPYQCTLIIIKDRNNTFHIVLNRLNEHMKCLSLWVYLANFYW